MQRRSLVMLLGAAAGWPLATRAQERSRRVFRLMWLDTDREPIALSRSPFGASLLTELAKQGYVEGRNLTLHRHFYERSAEPARIASALAEFRPDVILASSGTQVRSIQSANKIIPIVVSVVDPVAQGFATSMSSPGGNVTGWVADPGRTLLGKRLQFLRDLAPGASRIGFLTPRYSYDGPWRRILVGLAEQMGLTILGPPVEAPYGEEEYARAFAAMVKDGVQAVLVGDASETFAGGRQTVALAAEAKLPAVYPYIEFVRLGGLVAYAQDYAELGRHGGGQIARIFGGESPGKIPFYQATKFQFAINIATAKKLGIEVPPTLLAVADEVIE